MHSQSRKPRGFSSVELRLKPHQDAGILAASISSVKRAVRSVAVELLSLSISSLREFMMAGLWRGVRCAGPRSVIDPQKPRRNRARRTQSLDNTLKVLCSQPSIAFEMMLDRSSALDRRLRRRLFGRAKTECRCLPSRHRCRSWRWFVTVACRVRSQKISPCKTSKRESERVNSLGHLASVRRRQFDDKGSLDHVCDYRVLFAGR